MASIGGGEQRGPRAGLGLPLCAILVVGCGASEEAKGRSDQSPLETESGETSADERSETLSSERLDAGAQSLPPDEDTTFVSPLADAGDATSTSGGGNHGASEGGVCNSAGWCAVEPSPIADKLEAISGSEDGEVVFAVGAGGAIYQRDSHGWRMHEDVTAGDLHAVQVIAPNDVWVAGDPGIWHYDGAHWEAALSGFTTSLVATGSGELWAIVEGELRRYEGETLEVAALHSEASFLELGEEAGVVDCVAGAEPEELWVLVSTRQSRVYHDLRVFRFDGGDFTLLEGTFPESVQPRLVRVGAEVYSIDGSNWYDVRQEFEPAERLGDFVFHTSETQFVASTDGVKRLNDGEYVSREWPVAVWGSNDSELWVVKQGGGLVRVDGTQTAPEPMDNQAEAPAPWLTTSGIEWSASAQDAWRGPELEHFDGTTWTKPSLANPPYVLQMDGSRSDDVWFLGFQSDKVWHWNGMEVEEVATPATDAQVVRVRAFEPSQTWIGVGGGGFVELYLFDGRDWSLEKRFESDPSSLFDDYLVALAGPSRSNAYVAFQDELLHFDGSAWTHVFTPSDDTLHAVAVDADALWLLGEAFVYEQDGAAFTAQSYGFQPRSWIKLTKDSIWIGGGGPLGSGGGILTRSR